MGDSARTLNMGGASASSGVSRHGMTLMRMAADARRILVERAAGELSAPVEQLKVEDGVIFVNGDPAKRLTYAELIGDRAFGTDVEWNGKWGNTFDATSHAKLKKPSEYKVIGKSIRRADLVRKVFGQQDFPGDVKLPGMLHARMVRPPVAGAVPVSVDESSISQIPGAQFVWIKDLIAVVAPKEWNAVRALRALKVTWSDSKPNFPDHNHVHEYIRKAAVTQRAIERENGNVEEGLKSAARVLSGEYEYPTQSHASMGPACAVADVRADGVTVYTSTQKPHFAADGVAELLGLPRDKVRAIWMYGTGSYGRNDQGDATADAAVLSRALAKPVRVQWMREEALGWDPKGTAAVNRGRAGIDAKGEVIAYEFISKAFSRENVATYESRAAATLAGQLLGFPPEPKDSFRIPYASYTFAHNRLGWETVAPLMDRASPLRSTHLRDPAGSPILFGSESFMDEIAASLKMDPVDFRLKYLKNPREIAAVKIAAEKAGWARRPSPRADIDRTSDVVEGRGIALRNHDFATFVGLVAEVRVHRKTGVVEPIRFVCAHDFRVCSRLRTRRQSRGTRSRYRAAACL